MIHPSRPILKCSSQFRFDSICEAIGMRPVLISDTSCVSIVCVHISALALVSMDHIGSRLPTIRSTPIYGHSNGSSLVQGSFPLILCRITEFGSTLVILIWINKICHYNGPLMSRGHFPPCWVAFWVISIDCFFPVLGYQMPNVIAAIRVIGLREFLIHQLFGSTDGL